MFSTVIRHPMELNNKAPIIFLQYLAALAIVEGIKTYDKGYQDIPVKLKWPNDICNYLPHVMSSLTPALTAQSPRRPRPLLFLLVPHIRPVEKLRENRRHTRQLALFKQRVSRCRRHRPQHHQCPANHFSERSPAPEPRPFHPRKAPCPHPRYLRRPLHALPPHGLR